jgi:predicted dinucleotide-utilizing enzyme
MPSRVAFITHKGVEILHINWSGASPAEMLEAMKDARHVIVTRARGSVRTLTTVDGAHMDRTVTDALKDYVAHNKPYVLAGAVVGLNDLKMIAFNFVNRVTGRTLRAIDNIEAAKDWLAAQGG